MNPNLDSDQRYTILQWKLKRRKKRIAATKASWKKRKRILALARKLKIKYVIAKERLSEK